MNSVNLIGYLHENLGNNIRKAQISSPVFNDEGNNTFMIYLKYWAGGDRNFLTSLPNKSHVAIQGHLEYAEKFGTIVVVEQLYCLKKSNENS